MLLLLILENTKIDVLNVFGLLLNLDMLRKRFTLATISQCTVCLCVGCLDAESWSQVEGEAGRHDITQAAPVPDRTAHQRRPVPHATRKK